MQSEVSQSEKAKNHIKLKLVDTDSSAVVTRAGGE